MDRKNTVRLSSPRNRSSHSRSSPNNSPHELSSVELDFNPLGRIPSPRQSPKRQSPPQAPFRMSLIPSPRQSPQRAPFHMSLIPSPRRVRTPTPAWVELPKAASSSPKKPMKISPAKPKLSPALPIRHAPKSGFFSINRIHPVDPAEHIASVGIVSNKALKLPDKLLAIYYIDLIYETIKRLAILIKQLVIDIGTYIGESIYINAQLFDTDATSKLDKLIEDIDKDRYVYLTISNKKVNIKVSSLFSQYLIKNPRDIKTFLSFMLEIKQHQNNRTLEDLKNKIISESDIRKKRELESEIRKIEIELKFDLIGYRKWVEYIHNADQHNASINMKSNYLQNAINKQNFGLAKDTIYFLKDISHKECENKLQSLNETMKIFIDIINNILSDYEPDRTIVSNFSGGYVFFANYRYNKDDNKYTPLVYKYLNANSTNFQKIYDYFQSIFKYFEKINKRMADIYEKEYKNVGVKDEKHPEYKRTSPHSTHAINTTIATNNAVSAVKKQLNNISNNVGIKEFQGKIEDMNRIIVNTQKEINNLYHKI